MKDMIDLIRVKKDRLRDVHGSIRPYDLCKVKLVGACEKTCGR